MSILSIPYTFAPLTVAESAQVNSNFSAIQTSVNNIDNTNIGDLGLYANQIIPTSSAEATFGGTQVYQFPEGIQCNGYPSLFYDVSLGAIPISSGQIGMASDGTNGFILQTHQISFVNDNNSTFIPIYANVFGTEAAGGAGYCPPLYGVGGNSLGTTTHACFGLATFSAQSSVTVTLANASTFSANSTYAVFASGLGSFYAYTNTASTFTIATASGSPFTGTVAWFAVGY